MTQTLGSWLLALSIVGYSIIGVLGSVTGLGLAVPFRLVVIGLSLWLVVAAMSRPVPWRAFSWLFLFWTVYLSRLIWDFVSGVQGADEALVFFVATSLVPGFALCVARVNWVRAAEVMVLIGGLSVSLALAASVLGWETGLTEQEAAGRLAFSRLNPITVGHTGVTTLLAIMCLTTQTTTWARGCYYFAVAILAIASVVLAGSRGPLLALALCVVVFALQSRRWFLLIALSTAVAVFAWIAEATLLERLLALTTDRVDDTSALARLDVMANALSLFTDSPVLGSVFIEPEFQIYPHNLFIEALMATGVVGTFLLLALLSRAFLCSRRLMGAGSHLFPLLLLQYLVASQLSYAIWSISSLWVLLPLVLSTHSATPRRIALQRRDSGLKFSVAQ